MMSVKLSFLRNMKIEERTSMEVINAGLLMRCASWLSEYNSENCRMIIKSTGTARRIIMQWTSVNRT